MFPVWNHVSVYIKYVQYVHVYIRYLFAYMQDPMFYFCLTVWYSIKDVSYLQIRNVNMDFGAPSRHLCIIF